VELQNHTLGPRNKIKGQLTVNDMGRPSLRWYGSEFRMYGSHPDVLTGQDANIRQTFPTLAQALSWQTYDLESVGQVGSDIQLISVSTGSALSKY